MQRQLKFDILTIFPNIFDGFLETSLVAYARSQGLIDITCHNIRQLAKPPHYSVDDRPYGGGPGMIMLPDPLADTLSGLEGQPFYVHFSPRGVPLTQTLVQTLAKKEHLALICSRYEGVDQRFLNTFTPMEISLGDYVTMGGEVAAMVLIEASARLLPGVLGNEKSSHTESFQDTLLEAPHWTRPDCWREQAVPAVLKSGDHSRIEEWRRFVAFLVTFERRPDLLGNFEAVFEDKFWSKNRKKRFLEFLSVLTDEEARKFGLFTLSELKYKINELRLMREE